MKKHMDNDEMCNQIIEDLYALKILSCCIIIKSLQEGQFYSYVSFYFRQKINWWAKQEHYYK